MHCIFLKNHHSLKWDTLQFPPIYPSQRHNWPSSLEIIIFQNLEIFKIINMSKKKQKFQFFPKISKPTEGPPQRSKSLLLLPNEFQNFQSFPENLQRSVYHMTKNIFWQDNAFNYGAHNRLRGGNFEK